MNELKYLTGPGRTISAGTAGSSVMLKGWHTNTQHCGEAGNRTMTNSVKDVLK